MGILIIDDAEDVRLLIKSILDAAGYTDIVMAASAEEAIKILGLEEDEPGGSVGSGIDVILMDILLPEMNGIEATRKIKASKKTKSIPVIMVSAKDEADYLEDAFYAGANDYIKKPIDRVELVARVRSTLRLKEQIDTCKKELEEALRKLRNMEEG